MTSGNDITRREAVWRVSALLGGVAFVGGTGLLTACEKERAPVAAGKSVGAFAAEDIALLDEIAETILPQTSTPGAKAAQVGAFMALMVTDVYSPADQQIFRDGMRRVDEASRTKHGALFLRATPEQRLALLTELDREQKRATDAREAARAAARAARAPEGPPAPSDTVAKDTAARGEERLPDDEREPARSQAEASAAPAITADAPTHYFRMMKELALLGYFTSEIGYTQAMRYEESPGRFDPCVPYAKGEKSWAPHA